MSSKSGTATAATTCSRKGWPFWPPAAPRSRLPRFVARATSEGSAIWGRPGTWLGTRVGSSGRLFGSVTAADVVDAVEAAGGPKLDRRRVELTSPIKTAGTHTVSVRLHPEVAATVPVEVVSL